VVDESSELVESDGFPNPAGVAGNDADPLWVRGSTDGHNDAGVMSIPGIGKFCQVRADGGGEEAAGGDLNRELVAVPTGDSEVDVQPARPHVGYVEEFAVVLAAEKPAAASAQVTFDQVCGQRLGERLSRHEINAEACAFANPMSRAKRRQRIC